jgi:hypothetical protein
MYYNKNYSRVEVSSKINIISDQKDVARLLERSKIDVCSESTLFGAKIEGKLRSFKVKFRNQSGESLSYCWVDERGGRGGEFRLAPGTIKQKDGVVGVWWVVRVGGGRGISAVMVRECLGEEDEFVVVRTDKGLVTTAVCAVAKLTASIVESTSVLGRVVDETRNESLVSQTSVVNEQKEISCKARPVCPARGGVKVREAVDCWRDDSDLKRRKNREEQMRCILREKVENLAGRENSYRSLSKDWGSDGSGSVIKIQTDQIQQSKAL